MEELLILNVTVGSIIALLMIFGRKTFVLLREYGARFGLVRSLDLTNKARAYAKDNNVQIIMDHDAQTDTFSVKAVRYLPVSYTRAVDPFSPTVERMFEVSNLQMGDAWLKAEELAEFYQCHVHVTSRTKGYHAIHAMNAVRPTAC